VEKQNRILNAAIKEFAENGYERASTNQIVKNAGIGKGMLFYYFKNKEELYYYLVEYCLDFIVKELLQRIDTKERDFIERLKQVSQIKAEYYLKYPYVLNFLGNFFLQEELEIPDNFKKRYEKIMILRHSKLYDNIDKTLFRSDINTDKAFNLIHWSIEGYQNELMTRLKNQNITTIDIAPYWDEFYEYLDVLKTVYYQKKEGRK